MNAHAKWDHTIAPAAKSDPVVVCLLPSGGKVTATMSECIDQYGGHPLGDDRDPIIFESHSLFLYRLPSGNKVVGTHEQCVADGGTLVEGFDSREMTPSGSGSRELFICRLRSGVGIVATYDECLQDGGSIIGRIGSVSRAIAD